MEFIQDKEFYPPLDPGIERAVLFLRNNGFGTSQSCEGGEGHSSPMPIVQIGGMYKDLMAAASLLIYADFPVRHARRVYNALWGELVGPYNEITFYEKVPLREGDTITLGFDRKSQLPAKRSSQ